MVLLFLIMDNWVEMHYLLKVRKSLNTYARTVPIMLLIRCLLCTLSKEGHTVYCKKNRQLLAIRMDQNLEQLLEDELVLEKRWYGQVLQVGLLLAVQQSSVTTVKMPESLNMSL